MQSIKAEIQKRYGWYFSIKEVADYTNTSYFEIEGRPAIDVLSLIQIMKAKAEYNKNGN